MVNVHVVVDDMQTWIMKYKGSPLHLPKMMRANVVKLKAHIRSQIRSYEYLLQLITSIQDSHARVSKRMDVVVCMHVIPSIGTDKEKESGPSRA